MRNTRPRKRTAAQQFGVDYSREVNAAFVSRYGDGKNFSSGNRLNLHNAMSESLLKKQYSHLTNELNKKAKAEYKAEADEWNLALENISLADDVSLYVFFSPVGLC